MNLRKTILARHSTAQKNKILKWVGSSQERFDQLFDLFLNDEYRVVQRAGWPMSDLVMHHPQLISKHFGKLIRNLDKPGAHPAVRRNTVRLLQAVEIPKRYRGPVMNICFSYISSPDEEKAVKAFSLTVLDKLSELYPEIRGELGRIIEDRWEFETPAFKSRARKILKKISPGSRSGFHP